MSRHLASKHKNEVDVAKVLAMPKNSPERKAGWESLLDKGDFEYNYQVLSKKREHLFASIDQKR